MKLNERFSIEEYVPKSLFDKYGEKAVRFISTTIIEADLQLLKDLEALEAQNNKQYYRWN